MIDYVPDNYDQWKRHDDQMNEELERLPRCAHCGEPIQEEKAIRFDDSMFCMECIENYYTVDVVPE